MASYRNDFTSNDKTKFIFILSGLEQNLDITQIIFNVTNGCGEKHIISSLGTDNIIVNGGTNNSVEYIDLERKGGPKDDKLNKFALTLPFKTTNAIRFVKINISDTRNPQLAFDLTWDFK